MVNFFFAELKGRNTKPPVQTNASGIAMFGFSESFNTLNFVLRLNELLKCKSAHLHLGAQASEGSIIVDLFEACVRSISVAPGSVTGIITDFDLIGPLRGRTIAELASQMELGTIYASAASERYPAGEISGQLLTIV
ncbi:CHRD domain-containing protein [Bacillus cereus]|uniref:CHRD domain-containing protein n=1 Tax=Bacillus cereus TaxID=1396 RepID=UPI0005CF5339|nr:CHRD domain-containing protein [Bacillus cereus]